MYHTIIRITISLFLAILFVLPQIKLGKAQYAPPTTVTVTMYQLNQEQGGANTGIPCRQNDNTYGCTADPDNEDRRYPFIDSTITISIDGNPIVDPDSDGNFVEDNTYDLTQRYLWDVATQEIGLQGSNGAKPLAGVEAQAIASRTYTYQRILEGNTIDNSTNLHVYLPYMFETLDSDDEKNLIIEAMQHRYYMTPAQDNPNTAENEAIYPILAMYGADNRERTTEGILEGKTIGASINFLSAVDDPINDRYGCWIKDLNGNGQPDPGDYGTNDHKDCGTGNGGMSSKGASRWSYGHTSSKGPVAAGHANYPHDDGGLGEFWSVRLTSAEQILTHYYTSIHMRDANNNSQIVTPTRRWVPLQIFGLTDPNDSITLCKNGSSGFAAQIQNTEVFTWEGNAFELSYRNPSWSTTTEQTVNAAGLLPPVTPGEPSETTLVSVNVPAYVAPGFYTIELDMRKLLANGDYEWFSDDGWARYPLNVEVIAECEAIYLPLIQQDAVIAANE